MLRPQNASFSFLIHGQLGHRSSAVTGNQWHYFSGMPVGHLEFELCFISLITDIVLLC